MRNKYGASLKYFLFLILTTFLLSEAAIRLYRYVIDDDRIFYFNLRLPPGDDYWENLLNNLPTDGYYQYDKDLGWSIAPHSVAEDSLYVSNANGFRAFQDYPSKRDSTKLRIAVFGDSYTHGDQVAFKDSWPAVLESELRKRGLNCEVLNYGAGGYGMGQAYLRYLKEGKKMKPDIVILGIPLENFWRNINVFRPNYFLYTGLPLSKPRAIIKDDNLEFINLPPVKYDSLINLVREEPQYAEILKYETFRHNRLYTKEFPLSSFFTMRLLKGWTDSAFGKNKKVIKEETEGLEIMDRIVSDFSNAVKKEDSEFIILQLPQEDEIKALIKTGTYRNIDVLKNTFEGKEYNYCVIDSVIATHKTTDFYKGHYSAFGNQVVGNYFADWIIQNNIVSISSNEGDHFSAYSK